MLQQRFRAANDAQDRQDQVECEIVIRDLEQITGSPHWSSAFNPTVPIRPGAEKYFGSTVVNTLDYFRINADLNRVSAEREMLSILMSLGYQLEELEVEFWDDPKKEKWGRCVWYKDHPSYHKHKFLREHPGITPLDISVYESVFKTEHAGDKKFTLMSTQMIAEALLKNKPMFLFHKLLIFRRVVLSLPPSNYTKLAA